MRAYASSKNRRFYLPFRDFKVGNSILSKLRRFNCSPVAILLSVEFAGVVRYFVMLKFGVTEAFVDAVRTNFSFLFIATKATWKSW